MSEAQQVLTKEQQKEITVNLRRGLGLDANATNEQTMQALMREGEKVNKQAESNRKKTRAIKDPVVLSWFLLHPTRWMIVSVLKNSRDWMSYRQIAARTNLDRRLVTFHTLDLEQYGLVDRDLRLLEKESYTKDEVREGRHIAVSCFRLTVKARRVLGYLHFPKRKEQRIERNACQNEANL